ncbi:ATP-binding cassette domain-containing protein [bacterium]|nr:ATP-binding cassette domain-containing protein [bacterium]
MSIKVENLTKVFDGKKVLDNISFEVNDGSSLAIIGFSGSGKSTVLKIISGLIKADEGKISLKSDEVALVFQYSALFDSLNIFDNISFALHERKDLRKKYSKEEIKKIVEDKLKVVGLEGIEKKYPHELSGGMQKRVSFARAIVTNPQVILYDEPTAGLDPITSTVIENYINTLKRELGVTSIIVTHQLSTIRNCADRVIMFYGGKIVFEGTPEEMNQSENPYAKQFINSSIEGPMQMLTS